MEMHRHFVFLSSLALCGVLGGCTSSPSVAKPAPSPEATKPITIRAGTQGSWTSPIEAVVSIRQRGTYLYDLAFARVPPAPGEQPQACAPLTSFRLVSEHGTVRYIQPPFTYTGDVNGSVLLSAGKWTGISGRKGSVADSTISPPPPPRGAFWALGCPWSLTLTPSN